MEFYAAQESEFDAVRDFYDHLIDLMEDMPHKAGWKKGIYPTEDMILDAIKRRELYIASENGIYKGGMILNQEYNEEYDKVPWKVQAQKAEIDVIHLFGVLPTFHGQGVGKYMLEKTIGCSKEKGRKAIRLDVLGGNFPAMRLYERMGFQYRDTISMFYEDTGRTEFLIYEYLL